MFHIATTLWILTASAFASADTPVLDGPYQLEIRKHRFQGYTQYKFDRVVLEFVEHGKPSVPPTIKIVPHPASKEASIQVESAALVGQIPESKINQSYNGASRYLGPMAINTDDPGTGFTIRAFVKSPDTVIDAFWLTQPRRLVIDAFPRSSPRAEGPQVINYKRRGIASKPQASNQAEPVEPKPSFYCFPTSTKVSAIVKFRGANAYLAESDAPPSEVPEAQANEVSCFPATAALKPTISYAEGVVTIAAPKTEAKAPTPPLPPVAVAPPPPPKPIAPPPEPPKLATVSPDDMLEDSEIFGGAQKDDKDAPPPIQQEPQRIPTSPLNLTPSAKKAPPKATIQGLLPPTPKN